MKFKLEFIWSGLREAFPDSESFMAAFSEEILTRTEALMLKAKYTKKSLKVEKLRVHCTKMFRELRIRHPPTHTHRIDVFGKMFHWFLELHSALLIKSLSGQKVRRFV